MFVRAADQVSSNAAAESRAAVHSSQTRARQVDSDDGDNDYDGDDDDVADDDDDEQLCTLRKHALAR